MLGRDHLLLAGVAGIALLPIVAPAEFKDPVTLGISTVIVAGFGLLPDIDEPGSTLSRKLGFVSRGFSKIVKTLAGGHRKLTHSLIFVALIWILAYLTDKNWATWTTCIMYLITASVALKYLLPAMLRRSHLLLWGLMFGGAYVAYRHPLDPLEIAFLAASGTMLHIFGDLLTVEGVPLLYPMSLSFRFPIVGHTERAEDGPFNREHLLGIALALAFIIFAWLNIIKPSISEVHGLVTREIAQVKHSSFTGVASSVPSVFNSIHQGVISTEAWINGHWS
ncbi:metal-dependent hydrolase [Ferrimicrobium acidiphilum]|jgi:membrane-bound metal-dependent hydrolase YbcI (DUF457 family)|uniref:metal-dependent hydrolase n=1 Tax=Ferrimicrobium acidiphilum TaxID=121039 RepID=UPI0023EF7AD4|nr:metal-dependent hydrolase [Ferrimicrobium acidiphilum]